MNWLEITIDTEPDRLDALCARLDDLGVQGLVIEDTGTFDAFLNENRQYWDYIDENLQKAIANVCRVKFYLEDSTTGKTQLAALRAALPDLTLRDAPVRDEDWENNWKAYYKPMEVGRRLLILPEWETAEAGDRAVLRLDPGLIFGTGAHATTQMCLCALEDLAPGANVLDLGCGSGILSIAALLLGAAHATGCDIDPKAPDVALENAGRNGIGADRFSVFTGDVLQDAAFARRLGDGRYDLVLANIVADVLIAMAHRVTGWLAPAGRFICSGIIDGREAEVEAALAQHGLEILEHHRQEDWHCLVCRAAQ